ncbi:hypothetical protein DXG03_004690, partial [Asterophora parasitica]
NFKQDRTMRGARLHQVRSFDSAMVVLTQRSSEGYTPCRVLTGPDFQSVFNLQLWASNAKLINYYMFYGCVDQPV